MRNTLKEGYIVPELLVPGAHITPDTWSVIACDQYTSQPEYWKSAEECVGDSCSALHMILPEVYLGRDDVAERTTRMQAMMRRYIDDGTFRELPAGIMLTERHLSGGIRSGILLAMDLEAYSYYSDERPMIRASETTVLERIPPRVQARKGAPMELPHIMLLIDDPDDTVIGPLRASRSSLEKVYGFDLMMGGGHIEGWLATGENELDGVAQALSALPRHDGMLYCVGDGNHSLATAKSIWDEYKQTIPEEDWEASPLRYALCEVVNLHQPAVQFLPIHRVMFNVDPGKLVGFVAQTLEEMGERADITDNSAGPFDIPFLTARESGTISIANPSHPLAAGVLQPVFDAYLRLHPEASIDYIHGDDALRELSRKKDAVGFQLPAVPKRGFFELLTECGVLPRKTFSIGEANDKRFYLEARVIEPVGV